VHLFAITPTDPEYLHTSTFCTTSKSSHPSHSRLRQGCVMTLITALPTELIQQICEHLDKDSVLSLRRTCQDMEGKTH
jgi:hypothetical protein